MVRTSGGIRISAGKSSKKSGGGVTSGGGSRSTSTPGKSSGNTRLPPIPHCEAPSWQKPITNFFTSDAGSSKNGEAEIVENEVQLGCSSKNKENTDDRVVKIYEKNEISYKDSNDANDDGQSYDKKSEEEKNKENFNDNTC